MGSPSLIPPGGLIGIVCTPDIFDEISKVLSQIRTFLSPENMSYIWQGFKALGIHGLFALFDRVF